MRDEWFTLVDNKPVFSRCFFQEVLNKEYPDQQITQATYTPSSAEAIALPMRHIDKTLSQPIGVSTYQLQIKPKRGEEYPLAVLVKSKSRSDVFIQLLADITQKGQALHPKKIA